MKADIPGLSPQPDVEVETGFDDDGKVIFRAAAAAEEPGAPPVADNDADEAATGPGYSRLEEIRARLRWR